MGNGTGLRARLTYANVMSTIAVFGVLGGGAWAAAKIGSGDIKQNAVKSKHIKDGQVKAADLAANALGVEVQLASDTGGGFAEAIAECPAGKVAVGGGITAQKATAIEQLSYLQSAPDAFSPGPAPAGSPPTGWDGTAQWETVTEGDNIVTYVICVNG